MLGPLDALVNGQRQAANNGGRALAWVGARDNTGKCLYNVQEHFGSGHAFNDAYEQWKHTIQHGPDEPVPLGMPMFWASPPWSTNDYGHVALCASDGWAPGQPGRILTVDLNAMGRYTPGSLGLAPAGAPVSTWGHRYLGWGESLAGNKIVRNVVANSPVPDPLKNHPSSSGGSTTPTITVPKEDTMIIVKQKERGVWAMGPGYAHHLTPTEARAILKDWDPGLPKSAELPYDVVTYEDGPVGQTRFDQARAVHTLGRNR